jgi:hypothetical protein
VDSRGQAAEGLQRTNAVRRSVMWQSILRARITIKEKTESLRRAVFLNQNRKVRRSLDEPLKLLNAKTHKEGESRFSTARVRRRLDEQREPSIRSYIVAFRKQCCAHTKDLDLFFRGGTRDNFSACELLPEGSASFCSLNSSRVYLIADQKNLSLFSGGQHGKTHPL